MNPRSLPALAVLIVSTTLHGCSPAKTPAPNPSSYTSTTAPTTQPKSTLPDYPRVDLAVQYEVDPTWPKRPAGLEWGQMPGVALDKEDNVWIFTRATPPIQVYKATGEFIRAWGQEFIKTAHQIKIDTDGNIWIADVGNHTVRKCTADGKILLTLGTPGERGIDAKHLNMPTDMTIAQNGDVFVSDGYGNSRIVHFDKTGKFIKAWGTMGTRPGQFSIPHAIAIDSNGRLYIADRNNVRVQVYSQGGELLDSWKNLLVPWGFWVSGQDDIWICGSSPTGWKTDPKYPTAPLGCPPRDQLFMRFNTDGKLQQLWTIPKAEDGQEQPGNLNWVHGIALDSKGNIYAGDIIGKRVQKFVRKGPKEQ